MESEHSQKAETSTSADLWPWLLTGAWLAVLMMLVAIFQHAISEQFPGRGLSGSVVIAGFSVNVGLLAVFCRRPWSGWFPLVWETFLLYLAFGAVFSWLETTGSLTLSLIVGSVAMVIVTAYALVEDDRSGEVDLSLAVEEDNYERIRSHLEKLGAGDLKLFAFDSKGQEYAGVDWSLSEPRLAIGKVLLSQLSWSEMQQVLAHEAGHYQRRDFLWFRLVYPLSWLVGIGVSLCLGLIATAKEFTSGLASLAACLALLLGWLILMAGHLTAMWISRRNERAAHAWAIEATGDPSGYYRTLVKLFPDSMDQPPASPLRRMLYSTHPTLAEVRAIAAEWAARHGVEFDANQCEHEDGAAT